MKLLPYLAAATAFVLVLGPGVQECDAATVRVPSQFPTIQAGVNAASVGDTVLVAPGTYRGAGNRRVLITKDLVLKSEAGRAGTVVDAEWATNGIGCYGGTTLATRIEGFTIRRGYGVEGTGMGVGLYPGNIATITDCRFEENWAVPGEHGEPSLGGAVWCTGCVIADCEFEGNYGGWGGGVYLVDGEISECSFEQEEGGYGACLYLEGGTAINCTFNSSEGGAGGAVWLVGGEMQGCVFIQNRALVWGGAIYSSGGTVTGSDFVQNRILDYPWDGGGAAVYCESGATTMRNCDFYANALGAPDAGSAILVNGGATASIENSILVENLGGEPVVCENGGQLLVSCTDVYGHEAGDWVGCLKGLEATSGNFRADPGFCAPELGDLSLQASSPCLPGHHPGGADCGLIGAFGMGCTDPTAVESRTWGEVKVLFR